MVRQAIPHGIKVLHVFNPHDDCSSDIVDNIERLLVDSGEQMKLYVRARSSWKKESYYNHAAGCVSTARNYLTLRRKAIADVKKRRGLDRDIKAAEKLFAGEKEKHDALYAAIVKKEIEDTRTRNALRREEQKIALAKWKNGDLNIRSAWQFEETGLRIREVEGEKIVESTKGAHVTFKEAATLWHMIKAGKPIHGEKLSGYSVVSFDGEILKIGCHIIKREEINRIGALIDKN